MVSILWSSVARSVSPAATADSAVVVDLDVLFSAWEAATDKGGFISSLDGPTAAALAAVICNRVPKVTRKKRH